MSKIIFLQSCFNTYILKKSPTRTITPNIELDNQTHYQIQFTHCWRVQLSSSLQKWLPNNFINIQVTNTDFLELDSIVQVTVVLDLSFLFNFSLFTWIPTAQFYFPSYSSCLFFSIFLPSLFHFVTKNPHYLS